MSERECTAEERLQWLIDEGFVPALRRFTDNTWSFDADEDGYFVGPTALSAIDIAIACSAVPNAPAAPRRAHEE